MQGEAGGIPASMAQEQWQTAEIHPSFEQVGRKRVPQQVGTNGVRYLRQCARMAAHTADTVVRDRDCERPAWEEPHGGLILCPGAAEELEEPGRQHDEAIALAFGLADADHHAWALDIRDLEGAQFGHPQARARESGTHGTMCQSAWGGEQRRDVRSTQHRGHLLLATRMGDMRDHPGYTQRRVREEAEGTHDVLERPPCHVLLLDEGELRGTHVLRPAMLGRGVKMLRKRGDTAQRRAHRMRRVVAEWKIVTPPLASCGHKNPPDVVNRLTGEAQRVSRAPNVRGILVHRTSGDQSSLHCRH
jgi:hypothetical protein